MRPRARISRRARALCRAECVAAHERSRSSSAGRPARFAFPFPRFCRGCQFLPGFGVREGWGSPAPLSTLFLVSAADVHLRPYQQITSGPNPQIQSNAKAKTWPKSPTLDKPEDGAPTPKTTSGLKSKSVLLRQHQRCYHPSNPNQCLTRKIRSREKGGPPAQKEQTTRRIKTEIV